jgi:hypothetical protein
MSITVKTHKMLWCRSASKCAICRTDLMEDMSETDDPSVLGEEAHIIAREKGGPRGNSDLPEEQRDKYANLILLCQRDHKIIDDQLRKYTVEKLQKIKMLHLKWVEDNLHPDKEKRKDEEEYATYIEEFITLSALERWNEWTSFLLSAGVLEISKTQCDNLYKLNEYLLGRIWSRRYADLEFSFANFRAILNDFLCLLSRHVKKEGDNYSVPQFYRDYRGGDSAEYDAGIERYEYYIELLQDLLLELSRAANYIIIQVRRCISPSFRTNEGMLLVTMGPGSELSFKIYRAEFKSRDPADIKYKGLRHFMTARAATYHLGEGIREEYAGRS